MKTLGSLLCLFASLLSLLVHESLPLGFNSNHHHPRTIRTRLMRMSPLSTERLNRPGPRLGNSTNSSKEVAFAVGVQPPDDQATVRQWKRAYQIHKYATPFLYLFDTTKPPNSSLNLYCMWWKALSGNDPTSPVFDDGLAFDLLPRGTRHIVKFPRKWFPRLHHANVEIRTAYLDRAVTRLAAQQHNNNKKIRLVSLGAGYDVRSIKLRERDIVDECYELDLPEVVKAKRVMLESKRVRSRRPHIAAAEANCLLPKTYAVDLNHVVQVRTILKEILSVDNKRDEWHTIFLFEAVMIYLDESVPRQLLDVCAKALEEAQVDGSLCFADRLENVPGVDESIARQELASVGWRMVEWLPKPGLARHMGCAEPLRLSNGE